MTPYSSRLALGLVLMGGVACDRRESTVRGEAAGVAALASPSYDEALVRVVHAIPAEGPIDVFAGDALAFAAIAFRGVSDYARVTPNTPNFRIARAAPPGRRTLAEEMAVTRDGHAYTLVAMGGADSGSVEVVLIRDDVEPGDSTRAHIRIINAAARSGPLDIFLAPDDAPFVDDLDVRDDAAYRELEPGTVTLVVRPDDQRAELLRIADLTLRPGSRVTLVLTRTSPRTSRLSAIRVVETERAATPAARDRGR
jgi:hypothetical protein